jgi:hypothetical protein
MIAEAESAASRLHESLAFAVLGHSAGYVKRLYEDHDPAARYDEENGKEMTV